MWIAAILGLTGPKGLHFCKDCLCKLSGLSKGTKPTHPICSPNIRTLCHKTLNLQVELLSSSRLTI